jgi:hypothetical protein
MALRGLRVLIAYLGRAKLGWTQHGTRYCQLICDRNKVKRVQWCQEMLDTNETVDVSIILLLVLLLCSSNNNRTFIKGHKHGSKQKKKTYFYIQLNFHSDVHVCNYKHPVYIYVCSDLLTVNLYKIVVCLNIISWQV